MTLKKIEETCDKLVEQQSEMNQTLIRNTVTLEEHVKRTNMLEDKVEIVLDKELPPLKRHIDRVTFLAKVLPWALGIAGSLAYLLNYLVQS